MNRRRFLHATAGVGVVVLAGCTNSGSEGYLEQYRVALEEDDIDIEHLELNDSIVSLEYYSEGTEKYDITGIGTIVGTYAGIHEQGWNAARLNVRVLAPDGDLTATYYVSNEMVDKISSGELSDRELGEMAYSTVEMKSEGTNDRVTRVYIDDDSRSL